MTLYGCHSFMYCRASITQSDYGWESTRVPACGTINVAMSKRAEEITLWSNNTKHENVGEGEQKKNEDLPRNKNERWLLHI